MKTVKPIERVYIFGKTWIPESRQKPKPKKQKNRENWSVLGDNQIL